MSDYFDQAGDMLFTLRLIAEGMAELFDADTRKLLTLAMEHDAIEAYVALDTIGAALTELRTRIRSLQLLQTQEALRLARA